MVSEHDEPDTPEGEPADDAEAAQQAWDDEDLGLRRVAEELQQDRCDLARDEKLWDLGPLSVPWTMTARQLAQELLAEGYTPAQVAEDRWGAARCYSRWQELLVLWGPQSLEAAVREELAVSRAVRVAFMAAMKRGNPEAAIIVLRSVSVNLRGLKVREDGDPLDTQAELEAIGRDLQSVRDTNQLIADELRAAAEEVVDELTDALP